MNELTITSKPITTRKASQNPAAVYVASLTSQNSRRTMTTALNAISGAFGAGLTSDTFPWENLRHVHTAAIRAKLAETCSTSTANVRIAALKGVLKACWRLELMSSDDYRLAKSRGFSFAYSQVPRLPNFIDRKRN
jgi:hypothetical protein